MSTKEHNRETLQAAIRRLPQYAPAAPVWQRIEHQLENDLVFQDAVQSLPTYAPPVAVWQRIAAGLEKPVRMRRLRPAWFGAAAAAVVLLAVGTYWWYTQTPELVEKVQLVYTETETRPATFKADWDEDETDIAALTKVYAQRAALANLNESLLSELQELNQAKAAIKAMLTKYGNDPDLIRTIADLERQRSAIVKQMATAM
jgi:hypothetical protein